MLIFGYFPPPSRSDLSVRGELAGASRERSLAVYFSFISSRLQDVFRKVWSGTHSTNTSKYQPEKLWSSGEEVENLQNDSHASWFKCSFPPGKRCKSRLHTNSHLRALFVGVLRVSKRKINLVSDCYECVSVYTFPAGTDENLCGQ